MSSFRFKTDMVEDRSTKQKLSDKLASVDASLADNASNVNFYGAKGDWNGTTGTDDTTNLQTALNNFLVVDLKGKSYYVTGTLNVKSYQLILNGKIVAPNLSPVFYGSNVNNVTFQNVEIDGKGTSEKGIFINGGTNIIVSKCNIHDLNTINDQTIGVYFDNLTFSKVLNCTFNNINAFAAAGDANAASRAIVFNNTTYSIVDNCNISNVFSTDAGANGDGIQFIDTSAGESLAEIETDSFNVIKNCFIKNCTKRGIKLQQSGVLVTHNDFQTDSNMSSAMPYLLCVYASNITVENNRFEANTPIPIMMGNSLNPIIKNVTIKNNYITYTSTSYQGCVVMNDSQSIQNVLIDGNTFYFTTTSEQGVYIRTYAQNIRIVNNKMTNVANAVYIRDISGITPTAGVSYRQNILVSNNDVVCINNLVYEESNYIYDGLSVINNTLNITTPLSYAQNSVRLSNKQLANNPVISGNRIKNGFADGWLMLGTTSNRPSVPYIGLKYFDQTLNKPVFCKTSAVLDASGNITTSAVWVDATGTTV